MKPSNEIVFWGLLFMLFMILTTTHVVLLVQPDIKIPEFKFTPLESMGKMGTLDQEGNYQLVDPFVKMNQLAKTAQFFVQNDFAKVIKDINHGKRISNGLAAGGYFLAMMTCFLSLLQARKSKDKLHLGAE